MINEEHNQLMVYNPEDAEKLSNIFQKMQKQHNRISQTKTPSAVVKEVEGYDYVDLAYMKGIADKEFPGWSWIIIKYEAVGNQAFSVHGRLKWYDNGIVRTGDMVAGHRIQKLTRDPNKYLNIGSDLKSANTDCLKKAYNTYMNIADDVYKKMFPLISIERGETLLELAKLIDHEMFLEIQSMVYSGKITNSNYDASVTKLQKKIEESKIEDVNTKEIKE